MDSPPRPGVYSLIYSLTRIAFLFDQGRSAACQGSESVFPLPLGNADTGNAWLPHCTSQPAQALPQSWWTQEVPPKVGGCKSGEKNEDWGASFRSLAPWFQGVGTGGGVWRGERESEGRELWVTRDHHQVILRHLNGIQGRRLLAMDFLSGVA